MRKYFAIAQAGTFKVSTVLIVHLDPILLSQTPRHILQAFKTRLAQCLICPKDPNKPPSVIRAGFIHRCTLVRKCWMQISRGILGWSDVSVMIDRADVSVGTGAGPSSALCLISPAAYLSHVAKMTNMKFTYE